jgi:hypothetical protein
MAQQLLGRLEVVVAVYLGKLFKQLTLPLYLVMHIQSIQPAVLLLLRYPLHLLLVILFVLLITLELLIQIILLFRPMAAKLMEIQELFKLHKPEKQSILFILIQLKDGFHILDLIQ